jgi:ferredoxin
MGGLMGRPWQLFSLAKVMEITATVNIPVLGGGGAFTYDDCVRYLMGGCSLTGMCSSVYSRGVTNLGRTLKGLAEYMDEKGYPGISDFQGKVVNDFSYLRDWPRENPMSPETPIIPSFDAEACNGCGRCETLCPYGALTLNGGEIPDLTQDYCMGCGWCVGQCPTRAIRMVHGETGKEIWNGYGTVARWAE